MLTLFSTPYILPYKATVIGITVASIGDGEYKPCCHGNLGHKYTS